MARPDPGLVALDPRTNSPVIVLQENDGTRKLPIWIGFAEARSIAAELEQVEPVRPNTHDLAKRILVGLEGKLERVVVTDLREGTYFAVLQVRTENGLVEIDSRPSDAIAIALRVSAPIFVRNWLFDAVDATGLASESPGEPIDWRPERRPPPGAEPARVEGIRRNPIEKPAGLTSSTAHAV